MQTEVKGFHDYVEIVKRRKKWIILSVLIVFAIAATVSLVMPSIYKSTSTILIEEQEIPHDYIVSTVAGYAEQRLQAINQRVMSATKLIEIINKYNLYSDRRKRWTNEEIIEKMRKDIKFETVSAELDDPRSGRSKVTIAFTISYWGENPGTVQQISNVLASLYLEENLKVRGQQAEGAAKFFQEEMRNVQAKMADMDSKLAGYKEKNINSLPDLAQTNLQELNRLDQNVEQLNDQLKMLKEKEISLKTQLAGIPTDSELKEKTRLNDLRVSLNDLKSRFSDEYPDVIKMKQEIAELEKKSRDQKEDTAQRTNLQAKYDDLMKKYMEANVAQGLEKGQMGDRFTLIDPARLPEKPVRPNIPVFLLAGLVLGVTTGAGVAAVKEAGDKTIYTVDALARVLSVPLVSGIPEIVTPQVVARRKRRRIVIIIATVLFLIVAVVAFHFLVMDLDVFWARLSRRLSL